MTSAHAGDLRQLQEHFPYQIPCGDVGGILEHSAWCSRTFGLEASEWDVDGRCTLFLDRRWTLRFGDYWFQSEDDAALFKLFFG